MVEVIAHEEKDFTKSLQHLLRGTSLCRASQVDHSSQRRRVFALSLKAIQ